MEKSKKSGSQNIKDATTKPNSSTNSGVRNKERFALWVYPETMEEVGYTHKSDNCRSKSEFIEKAIQFYLCYLKQERNINYLSPRITSSVELRKIAHTLAAANDVDEDTLHELHMMCVDEVRHINGVIDFESAVRFQNE